MKRYLKKKKKKKKKILIISKENGKIYFFFLSLEKTYDYLNTSESFFDQHIFKTLH